MHGILQRTRWLPLVIGMGLATALVSPPSARADAKADYLVRLLGKSKAFRVRAQAALSLGRLEPSKSVRKALGGALKDKHPAVRIAAISSLGRIGDASSVVLLERATKDRVESVRDAAQEALRRLRDGESSSPDAKYYVAVDKPGSKAKGMSASALESVRRFLTAQVSDLEGVELATVGESPSEVSRVLEKRKLKGFIIQSSVAQLDKNGASTRAVVSVILSSYPGREMRAMLRGAATVTGGDPSTRAKDAIEGAITGAMRRLPGAMQASR